MKNSNRCVIVDGPNSLCIILKVAKWRASTYYWTSENDIDCSEKWFEISSPEQSIPSTRNYRRITG